MIETIACSDNRPLPELLYHYCSSQGFEGIIRNRKIWLSDSNYCNDYMEHNWLKAQYDRRISFLREKERTKFHDALAAEMANHRELMTFIACFSEDADTLSQWRAYADNSNGFAIGFKPKLSLTANTLPTDRVNTESSLNLIKVCYNAEKQTQHIETTIERYQILSGDDPSKANEYAKQCYLELELAAIGFKNPKFREENEWRIVYRPTIRSDKNGNPEVTGGVVPLRFRLSQNNFVPYFELPFSQFADNTQNGKVVLGPKRNLTRESQHLFWFLSQHADNCFGELKQSEATYR